MTRGGIRRAFRTSRRPVDEDERILPLINVVFLLLVFFMVAGRLTADDPFPLEPPRSASEGPPTEGLLIALGPGGELALDGAMMGEADLLTAVQGQLARAPQTEIRVKADGGAQAAGLVALLGHLRKAGAETVMLMTVPEAM